jgi:signal transduction histidine kinase
MLERGLCSLFNMSVGGRVEQAAGASQSQQLREHVAALLAEFDELSAREAALRGEVEALRQELERARGARGAFVGHLSHEILTPLNAVVGLAEQLYDGATSGEQRELARGVRAGGEHLTRMLGGILELSRIESDALTLAWRPFDLVAEVERAVEGAAPFAASRRVELCVTASERARVQVIGDAGRLRLVIGNAVDDAAKFSEAGDVEVAVDVVGRTDEAVEVEVEVRDHGVEFARRTEGSGLGIGMTVCARMCELMGGSVALTDHPEGGAVVRVRVRLTLAAAQTIRGPVELAGRRIRVDTASRGLRSRTVTTW